MSKYANAGELRTPVFFMRVEAGKDEDGYPKDTAEVNVFGKDVPVLGKWVNAHGTDVLQAVQLELKEPATFTTRYSPLIKVNLIIYLKSEVDELANDAKPFEIISVDNVENRNIWVEIKLQRKVPAR